MMSAVNILSKDDRTGEPLLAVVAATTKPMGVENQSVQEAVQKSKSLDGVSKDSSVIVLDEETNAAVAVQHRLQQVNEVLQRLQSPLQCTICLDLLSAPVTTKCAHSFCMACMHRILGGVRGPSPCPLCLAPVTKRSLTTQPRITQIVSAVRAIIDSIKKDCGLMATPSKYRPRARPHTLALEDNSDEEEMDEPRRGTRKRFLAPDTYLDVLPIEHGPGCADTVAEGGRKRTGSSRGRRGGLGGGVGKKNISAPDLPSLVNQEASAGFRTGGPSSSFCKLSKSRQPMTASSSSLSGGYEELIFPRTTGFALCRPPPAGLPRGRGRGRGAGRGKQPSIRGAVEATDDELVSVSQVAERQQQLAHELKAHDSGSDVDSAATDKDSKLNIGKNVAQQKPKEKVAQWLDQSSNLGFKIGLSQRLHDGSSTKGNFCLDDGGKRETATGLVSPMSAAEVRAQKTSPGQQTSNQANLLMGFSAPSKEFPYSSQGSTVVFDLASVPANISSIPMGFVNKALNSLTTPFFNDDFQEMELPDIESITDYKEVTAFPTDGRAAPPCSSAAASTPMRGRVTAAAVCNVSAIYGSQDTIPDSCPVVTKDAFDVLVDTARTVGVQQHELKPSDPGKGSALVNDESLDDVYFFRTPADGLEDKETTNAAAKETSNSKKRTLEESELPSIINKKSKLAVETEPRCYSSASTLSFSNTQKKNGSNGSNHEPKMANNKLVNKRSLQHTGSHPDQIEASLLPSCEAMPPPPAPVEGVSKVGAAARRLRPSKAATKTTADTNISVTSAAEEARLSAEKTRNTRYASQLKKPLCEPPKLVATSVGIKDTKSPGWSHVVCAKKDLKTRHVGLNITGGECKLEITKLDGSVRGEIDNSIAPVHRRSSTNQVLSSGESSIEIDDQTQKFDVEHLDCMPGNLLQVQKMKRLVKNLSHDNTEKANKKESNGSDLCDSNNSANSEDHGPTAAQTAADSCPSKNGFMGLSSKGEFGALTDYQLTSVPETQTSVHSPVSNCLASFAKDTASPGHDVEHPVTRNASLEVPSVDGFKVLNTTVGASSKLVDDSSLEQLETAVKSKSDRFQVQTIKGDGYFTKDVRGNEAIHCQQAEAPGDTAGRVALVAGVDQGTEGGSKDITDFTAPLRRTVRSGKLRRETRSLRPTSSSSTASSVKSKLRSEKSTSSTGGSETMSVQSTAVEPLVSAGLTKLRKSLRSSEIDPAPIITGSVLNVTSTPTSSDIGAVVSFPPDSRNKTAASACNAPSTVNGVSSQTTSISKLSTATAYCDTEATKYTSLATLSSPNELHSSSKTLTSRDISGQHESQGKQSSNHPAGRPVRGCSDIHLRRTVVISEEDSEGLNFEEQTITPTMYKNKRMQADLSVPRAHVAVQCEPHVPDTRSVAVQCDLPRDLALECGMQTETGTASVGVQVQLAPHHLYVHGVIPYAATGPNCSDRCAGGGTASLLQVAGLQPESLHAVPCSLYQAMIGMLHLAQPNPTCRHYVQDAAHVQEAGYSPDRGGSIANPALATPVKSSDGAHDKTLQLEHQPKQSSTQAVTKANINVALHGSEVPASAISASSDGSVNAAADGLLVSGGPTRRSYTKKLHEAAAVRGALMGRGASSTCCALVPVPIGSANLPPSGFKRKEDDSGESGKPVLKSCSVRLFSPKKGELEALSSLGTFPSTVVVEHSKDSDKPEEAALRAKLLHGDSQIKSSSEELSSEIPCLLEPGSLRGAKLAKNQSKVLSQDSVSHKSQNSSSSQASVSLLKGNSNVDAKVSVEVQSLAKASATTGPSVLSRLTRLNSKGAEKKGTDSLSAAFSPQNRKKAALEADEAIEDVASSDPDDGVVAASHGEKENRMKGAQRSSGRPRRRPLQLQPLEPSNTDLMREDQQDEDKPPRAGAAMQGSKQLFSSADSSSLTTNTKRSIVKSRTNLFESMSDSRNAKITAGKRFKRIRTFDNSDSSSEDEVQKKKPNTKQSLVSFTIGSCANPDDAVPVTNIRNGDPYQKNSEELRLDQFDDGLFEYFGLNTEKTENSSSVSTSKRVDQYFTNNKSSSTPKVVDLHTSFDELPELGNTENVVLNDAGDAKVTKSTVCEDDDDEIPGTAEVLKNVAADIARIRKMRESAVKNIKMEKDSTAFDNNEDEFLSQETVVLSSTQGSVQDSNLHNRYNLARSDIEAKDSEASLSATNRTVFTTQTRELFSRCDRSLRKVEQRLHSSQDSEDATSSMTAEGDCRAGLDADASVRSTPRRRAAASKGSLGSGDSDDREEFKRPDASQCNNVEINSISQLRPACGGEDNSLSHLSMMSTQSEVVSTQYRNRVQNEVDLLKAKMVALQEELLNCKPSAADKAGQTTNGVDSVPRATGCVGPAGGSEESGQPDQAKNGPNSGRRKPSSDDGGTIDSNTATSKGGSNANCKVDGVSVVAPVDEESDMFCSQQSTAPEAGAKERRVVRGRALVETDTPSSESDRLVLVCTGLTAAENVMVLKLARTMGGGRAEVLRFWRSDVTHVIVRCGTDSTTDRTLKYLYGVASGCWVISIAWVRGCLQKGVRLPEGEFEALDSTGVPGPYRGRLYRSRLLRGAAFCCLPPFNDVTDEQLQDLVRLCGGTLVSSPDQFPSSRRRPGDSSSLQLIVMQAGEDGDGASRRRAQELGARHGRLVVAGDWLIECVAMYARIGLSPYVLSAPDDQLRLASGVSEGLMQETQDF